MPLSKARMRDRKRADRAVKPMSNLETPLPVKPTLSSQTCVKPNDSAKQAKLAELRALIAKPKQEKPKAQEEIPIYNPAIHRPGDKVKVFRNGRYATMTIPHLDADGNPF